MAAQAPDNVRSLTLVSGWATTDARMRFTFDLWRRLIAADPELFARYAIADGLTAAAFETFGVGVEAMVPLMTSTVAPGSDAQLELDMRVDIARCSATSPRRRSWSAASRTVGSTSSTAAASPSRSTAPGWSSSTAAT